MEDQCAQVIYSHTCVKSLDDTVWQWATISLPLPEWHPREMHAAMRLGAKPTSLHPC